MTGTMSHKVLGQAAPSATTDTTLYEVPSRVDAIVSAIVVCNRSSASTYRIAIRPKGAPLANEQYIAYDAPIEANETHYLSMGLTLSAGDIVTVRAGSASVSFSAFGAEVRT